MDALADLFSVATVPLVPGVLWSNAGFGTLRQCRQLDGVDARYDPTVIPLSQPDDEAPASYTDKSNLRTQLDHASSGRFYSIKDFHDGYSNGAFTPSDVIERLLPLIRRDVAQRSPCATAFMETKVDLVRQAAQASTQRYKEGEPLGILDGVPFGVKDDLLVKDYKHYVGTTHDYSNGGSKESSWCAKMLEKEGAILVGTLTMHELGMGKRHSPGCDMSNWLNKHRYNQQQPPLGYTTKPIQQLLLPWRLFRRRRICRRPRPDTLCHWIRWRRLCPHPQQLLRRLRPQALAFPRINRPNAQLR